MEITGRFDGARVSSAEELRAVLDSAVERKAVGFSEKN